MNLRESRAVEAATQLLEEIVGERYPADSRLPTETALCERLNVSRATLREAMKSLQQRGVIRIEQGRGSFVNPRRRWSALDPLLMAARSGAHDGATEEWSRKLRDARSLVEVGVAEMAASRRTDDDVAALTEALAGMRTAHEADDVVVFTHADLAFHRALSHAVDNELIAALFDPIAHLIEQERLRTSRSVDRRQAAIAEHEQVLRAVSAGRPRAANRSMAVHIEATYEADPGPVVAFVDRTKGRRGA
jgi:GntR family transcriptional repressor for pyruvate dehydrogenase complex